MRSSFGGVGGRKGKGNSSSSCYDDVPVVAIVGVAGSSKADEWNDDMLRSGDVLEQIIVGGNASLSAPFKGGNAALQKALHKFYRKNETLVKVRVRRGPEAVAELQACITPDTLGKKQYTLRALRDPNYYVGFVDSTLEECLALQASSDSRVESALNNAQLRDGFVAYSWEANMSRYLPVSGSGSFYSLLIVPRASEGAFQEYNTLEDTMARAHTWLSASQDSGVPIFCLSIQTEPLLTKISGEKASSTVNTGSPSELSRIANASLYGFEDYHGVDIGVVRAIRLWYVPTAGERALKIQIAENDTRLGFAISRSEEGFFYVSSVSLDEDGTSSPASRSGLSQLFHKARKLSKLLTITRVGNEKILPWMVSSAGGIRCFDSISVSQKLCLHRHARRPVILHLMLCEELSTKSSLRSSPLTTSIATFERNTPGRDPSLRIHSTGNTNTGTVFPDNTDFQEDATLKMRDTASEFSFRYLPPAPTGDNWV